MEVYTGFPLELKAVGDVPRVFTSPQVLAQWAGNQERLGKTLLDMLPIALVKGKLGPRFHVNARELRAAAEQVAAGEADGERKLRVALDAFSSKHTLPFDTPFGMSLMRTASVDPEAVIGAILGVTTMADHPAIGGAYGDDVAKYLGRGRWLIDQHLDPTKPPARQAIHSVKEASEQLVELDEELQGIKSSLKLERERVDKLSSDLTDTMQRLNESREQIERSMAAHQSELALLTKTAVENYGGLNELVEKLQEKTTGEARAAIDAATKVFNDRQHLKQPIAYWKEKRAGHVGEQRPYANLGIAAGAVFVIGLAALEYLLFELMPPSATLRLWPYGVTILYVTLGLWFLRMVAKLYFSAKHLAEDAHEREVMTDGLFSLMNNPEAANALKSGGLERVVEILYRPSSKGMIKDDGPALDPNEFVRTLRRKD